MFPLQAAEPDQSSGIELEVDEEWFCAGIIKYPITTVIILKHYNLHMQDSERGLHVFCFAECSKVRERVLIERIL